MSLKGSVLKELRGCFGNDDAGSIVLSDEFLGGDN
jgi:hypothetical protein